MQLLNELRQYYRYRRNCRKLKAKKAKTQKRIARDIDFYEQFIGSGDLVFDIGANIGDKSEVFVQLGAKVVAVEPQKSCWKVLKRRFNEQVSVEPCAVSDSCSTTSLFVDKSTTLSSTSINWIVAVKKSGRFASHNWSYNVTVETITLDALIAKYGVPKFCKIDVEGGELSVLKGLSQPVGIVSFEYINEYAEPVIDCVDYLAKLGPVEYNFTISASTEFSLNNWVGHEQMTNIIKQFSDKYIQGDIYARFPKMAVKSRIQ